MANDNNNDATGRIYLVVPVKYRCTYNRLLTALSDFGIDALKDCDSVCKGSKGQVIKCWNMFQAAMAAYELGNEREADVLIKYIDAQLNIIYKDGAPSEDCPNITCCDYQVVLELLKAEFKDLMLEALAEYFGPTPPTPTTKYTVTVITNPSNANVTINGQAVRTLQVDAGSDVDIYASLTGYISASANIENISRDETVNLTLSPVPAQTYTLTVNPTPNNATVLLNGQSRRSITVESGTTVRVQVSASGYQSYDQNVVVNSDRTLNVTLDPIPVQTYTVTVNPTPNNATVLINGQNTRSLEVPAGSNVSIQVSAPGYYTENVSINNISQDETRNITLTEIPPSPTPVYQFVVNNSSSDSSISVDSEGETKQINYVSEVTVNGETSDVAVNVALEAGKSWLAINHDSTNKRVTVIVQENTDTTQGRSADITFTQQDSGEEIVVTITQAAATPKEYLRVYDSNHQEFPTEVTTLYFSAAGETKTIDIESNTSWTIE